MKDILLIIILLFSISIFAQKKTCMKKASKYELQTKHKCRFKQKKTSTYKKDRIIASKPSKRKHLHSKYYKKTHLQKGMNKKEYLVIN